MALESEWIMLVRAGAVRVEGTRVARERPGESGWLGWIWLAVVCLAKLADGSTWALCCDSPDGRVRGRQAGTTW